MSTVENDTMTYHARLADETKIQETCTQEVEKYTDKELIEYICDYQSVENDFYEFIMADLKNFYNPKIWGVPNLLIELFQKENYLVYFNDLTEEKKSMVREIVINHRVAKAIEYAEEFGS